MTSSRPGWTRLATVAVATAFSAAALGVPVATAAAHEHSSAAAQARSEAAAQHATALRARTDRLLEGRRRHLARCMQRHPGRCARWQTSVERAEKRLGRAETQLGDASEAPVVTVSAGTLSWAPVAGAGVYLVKRRTAGAPAVHWLVYGTSVTPPPAAGETVEYVVRVAARDGEWSAPVTITYPASSPPPAEGGSGSGSGPGTGGGSAPGSGSEPESGSGSESTPA